MSSPFKEPPDIGDNDKPVVAKKGEEKNNSEEMKSVPVKGNEEKRNESSSAGMDERMTINYKASLLKKKNTGLDNSPVWNKVFIEWKEESGVPMRGFLPDISHYYKLIKCLSIQEEEILRINDCKSGAGFIVFTLKAPINVLIRFKHLKDVNKIEDDTYFAVRGLKKIKTLQDPVEVVIKNGSEVNLGMLKEVMEKYGTICGNIENIQHSFVPKEGIDTSFLEKMNKINSGRLKFRIKLTKPIPCIVPVAGKKVELICNLQKVQCFKCLKFGHIRKNCTSAKRVFVSEFEAEFRRELGLTTRIESNMTLDKDGMDQDEPNGYADDTGGINNSNSKKFRKENQPKATPLDGRKAVQNERKEASCDNSDTPLAAQKETFTNAESTTSPETNNGEPENKGISYLQSNKTACSMRDDWKLVMRRKSPTPEQSAPTKISADKKKVKRIFSSPDDGASKRIREVDGAEVESPLLRSDSM